MQQYIDNAVEQFKTLLTQQIARQQEMENNSGATDYQSLDKIIIGSIIRLVPGIALTTSIRDFLGGDYLSGTIRMIDAFLVGGCIAIGVGAVVMLYVLAGGAMIV